MGRLKRLGVVGLGLLAATACAPINTPNSTPAAATQQSELATLSAPFPILSAANVASIAEYGIFQTGLGGQAACSLQGDVMAAGDLKTLTVYRDSSLKPTLTIQTSQAHSLLAVSPEGQRIAVADATGELEVWDALTGKAVRYMKMEPVTGNVIQEIGMYTVDLAYGPGHWLAVGATAKAYYMSGDSGQINRIFGSNQSRGSRVALSADGQLVALANEVRGAISVWKTSDGQPVKQVFSPTSDWITGLAFSNDGATLAGGNATSGIYFWDAHSGQLLSTLAQTGINTFALSRDGTLLFGARGNQVMVWEIKTGALLRSIDASANSIQVLKTCLDGRFLLTSSAAGDIVLWGVKR